jgi:hypothetical protein
LGRSWLRTDRWEGHRSCKPTSSKWCSVRISISAKSLLPIFKHAILSHDPNRRLFIGLCFSVSCPICGDEPSELDAETPRVSDSLSLGGRCFDNPSYPVASERVTTTVDYFAFVSRFSSSRLRWWILPPAKSEMNSLEASACAFETRMATVNRGFLGFTRRSEQGMGGRKLLIRDTH